MRLVFLHGIGGLARGFDAHVAYFTQLGFQAIALNQPGYGEEPIVSPYLFDGVARVLYERLNANHVNPNEPTVLIGHSMGGMLAQTFAHSNNSFDQPLNLVGLVLAHTSPAFGNSDGEFQQQFISARTAPLDLGKTMRDVAQNLVPTMVGPTCSDVIRAQCVALMADVPADTYRAALGALVQFDARPFLNKLTLPVLCLAAEHDKTAPAAVLEKLATKLAQGQFEVLSDVGHLAPMENPDLFCKSIENFVRKISA
jgi:3-oxoadipate enol-lactonase